MNPRVERELDEILNGRVTRLPRDTAWRRFKRNLRLKAAQLRQPGSRRWPSFSLTNAGLLILLAFALSPVLFFWRGDLVRLSPPVYTLLVLLMAIMLFAGYFLNFTGAGRLGHQQRWRGKVIDYRRRSPIEDWWWKLRNRR